MLEQVQVAVDKSLMNFCDHFWRTSGRRRIKDPEYLAMACRRFYGIKGHLTLKGFKRLLLGTMGVTAIVPYPQTLDPEACSTKKVTKSSSLFALTTEEVQLFTLAHELREILGACFKDIHPKLVDAREEDLEAQADAFAATIIYGDDAFGLNVFEHGLDPIRLGKMYNRSYRTALTRIIRNLAKLPRRFTFWGAIYEIRKDVPEGFLRSGGAFRNPKFDHKSRGMMPNALFAKRGQLVPIKNHLKRCLTQNRSLYIETLTGLDYWEKYPLSVVIRPHLSAKGIDRLIVIAILKEDNSALRQQILRCRPMTIEKWDQTI
ncbi:MAG: hypothetical protein IPH59_17500 [bacterium]|nr:hypothetical protein [bacterium]